MRKLTKKSKDPSQGRKDDARKAKFEAAAIFKAVAREYLDNRVKGGKNSEEWKGEPSPARLRRIRHRLG